MFRLACLLPGSVVPAALGITGVSGQKTIPPEKDLAVVVKAVRKGTKAFRGKQVGDIEDPNRFNPVPGGEIRFVLRGAPAVSYQAAASLGNSGIPVSGGRTIPLALDPLLVLSVSNTLPTVFKQFSGVCDARGDAAISIVLPASSGLKGITLHVGFVNLGGGAVLNISNDHAVTIR